MALLVLKEKHVSAKKERKLRSTDKGLTINNSNRMAIQVNSELPEPRKFRRPNLPIRSFKKAISTKLKKGHFAKATKINFKH